MTFNISGFTHTGTERTLNEDRILLNGQILEEGFLHLSEQSFCSCFVADGVGGNNAGEFAAHFILEAINKFEYSCADALKNHLKTINTELIKHSSKDKNLMGSASTLSGLIINDNEISVVHAGDSEVWLLRNDLLLKVTNDHVLNPYENNSPITSYFGGHSEHLVFDKRVNLDDSECNDIFLICSDGLFKSVGVKMVKSILKANKMLHEKSEKILENALLLGAIDNLSAIIVERTI